VANGSIIDLNTVTTGLPADALLETQRRSTTAADRERHLHLRLPLGKTAPIQGFVLIPV